MTDRPPHFDLETEQLVTRLFDLSDAGDFGNGELKELDSMVYTRMAEYYGLDASKVVRTFT